MSDQVYTIVTHEIVTIYMQDGSCAECSECEQWRELLREEFKTEVPCQYRVFFFNRIKVKTESERRGSILIEALTKVLDEQRIAVVCTVQPYADGRMDAAELENWYRKYGFETIKGTEGLLLRLPTKKSRESTR